MPAVLAAAFVGGILTIVAPCSLPVLPLALGAAGSRRSTRLVAVGVGFAATFLLTTIILAAALASAGLTTDPLRSIAALVLAAAGIALLWPRAWTWLTGRAIALQAGRGPRARPLGSAPLADGTAGQPKEVLTGLAYGAGLGLLWAPCTGPVMAPVIAGAIVAGPTPDGVSIAVAYVAGAALSLVAVAMGGRTVVRRAGTSIGAVALRRGYGLVVLVTALAIVTGTDLRLQAAIAGGSAPAGPAPAGEALAGEPDIEVPLRDLGPAPELTGITDWINSPPLTLASLRGKVVLVHFWTFGCINCRHVQPYVKQWYETYRDDGFVVVGVHTPELSYERVLANVQDAVVDAEVKFPVAFDPDFATWRAYGNGAWPAFYFIDRTGEIRYAKGGEGGYDESETVIRELLAMQ